MLRRLLQTTPLLALVALAVTACEVRSTVTLDVAEDGSGTVEAAVGLDDEALAQVPDLNDDGRSDTADLAALVRVDDMRAAGWTVAEPAEDEGLTWLRASKPFGTPEEAVAVLAEVTGAEGALREVSLERSTGFGSTSYSFAGTLDLSGGIEAFGDAGLSQVLDGEPLGEDAAAIEQRIGQPLADAFALDFTVRLPGSSEVWSPRLGDAAEDMSASSTQREAPVLALAAVSVASGAALVVVLLTRLLRRR